MIEFDAIDLKHRANVLAQTRERFDYDWAKSFVEKHGSPVLVFDQEEIATKYEELQNAFPRIKHYFAVKPLPLQEVVNEIAGHDGYIDVATRGEIGLAKEAQFTPPRMIHTFTHRKIEDIQHAIDNGIVMFVVDTLAEIEKFKPFRHKVKLLIRLSFPNDLTKINLSYKFGVTPEHAGILLKSALEAKMKVVGVTMHIGSQSDHTELFVNALKATAGYFEDMKRMYDHEFEILDIGGGFPASYDKPVKGIQAFADEINPLIEKHFLKQQVISEPGRYVVNSSLTLLSTVTGQSVRNGEKWCFIDDGIYGSFSGLLFDFSSYIMFGAKELKEDLPLEQYIVGGPTCDSHDLIHDKMLLPELEYDDLLITPNIGAYSWTHSTNFNLIPRPKVFDRNGKRIG